MAAGPAGVGEELEALHLGGELGLDDLDGGDLAVAQVEGGGGGAVLAVSSAAGEDLVLDVAALTVLGAAAQDDGAAAGALGDSLVGDERAHGLEHGLGHHEGGGHVGVHRGGVVGADHGCPGGSGPPLPTPSPGFLKPFPEALQSRCIFESIYGTVPSCIGSRRRLGGDMRHHGGDYRGPVGVSSIVYLGMNA